MATSQPIAGRGFDQQRCHGRLREPAENQAGQSDAELARGEIQIEVSKHRADGLGAQISLGGKRFDASGPNFDQRELRGDKKTIQENEDDRREKKPPNRYGVSEWRIQPHCPPGTTVLGARLPVVSQTLCRRLSKEPCFHHPGRLVDAEHCNGYSIASEHQALFTVLAWRPTLPSFRDVGILERSTSSGRPTLRYLEPQ